MPSFKTMLLQAMGARVQDPPEEPSRPSPPTTPPNPSSKPGNQGDNKGIYDDLGDIKLLDAWLAVEMEILALKERESGANGEAIRDAKKRERMLWRQVLRMWGCNNLLKRKRKSKAKSKQGAPVEQVEQVAPDEQIEQVEQVEQVDLDDPEFSSPDKMSDAEFFMTEEPPCKKPRLQVASELSEHEISQHEISDSELSDPATASASRSRLPTRTRTFFTTHQRDQMRALICAHLGNRSPPEEEVEETAQDAGLTVDQVSTWIRVFYKAHPSPTLEQVLAWRTKYQGVEDRVALQEWLAAHQDYPYPSDEELAQLASETGRTTAQLKRWFKAARLREGLTRPTGLPFSKDHTALLAEAFDKAQFPSQEELQRLAGKIGADVKRVRTWFGNQRRKQGIAQQKRPRLSAEQVAPLRSWLHGHMDDPCPSREERKELRQETGLSRVQLNDWFLKARARIERNRGKKEYESRCPCCGATNI